MESGSSVLGLRNPGQQMKRVRELVGLVTQRGDVDD
jgi:hypothetical protein